MMASRRGSPGTEITAPKTIPCRLYAMEHNSSSKIDSRTTREPSSLWYGRVSVGNEQDAKKMDDIRIATGSGEIEPEHPPIQDKGDHGNIIVHYHGTPRVCRE